MCRLQSYVLFFFFQAEDGIRDGRVTGVQTCALPIYLRPPRLRLHALPDPEADRRALQGGRLHGRGDREELRCGLPRAPLRAGHPAHARAPAGGGCGEEGLTSSWTWSSASTSTTSSGGSTSTRAASVSDSDGASPRTGWSSSGRRWGSSSSA